jgi:hypothetical protein
MKRWALGLVLAGTLPTFVQACGDDAKRTASLAEAGETGHGAGGDGAGQSSTPANEGGGSPVGEGGNNGGMASGDAGALATNAGAGNGGDTGAGGAACDYADELLSASELCNTVRGCYPDVQDVETQCVAPGDGAAIESYIFVDPSRYPNAAAIRACLCALPDPEPARGYIACSLAAQQQAAGCFSSCPALGETCGAPFQDSSVTCNEQYQDGFIAVATCVQAQ